MTTKELIDDENASDKLNCPQCGSTLPARAIFCSSCGERIKEKKNEERQAHTIPGSKPDTWGWMPALSLVSAVGLLLVALAYEGGRVAAQQWPESLFWFGLVVLFLPIAVRLFSAKPARRERIALLVVLTISLYLVKFLQYPLYFAYYDEFLHVRTAQTIAASGHLFQPNSLLPISAFYPGLEIITNALSSLTGLSIFVTGTVLIGVALLLFVLSLYLLYEHVSNSMRVAGIATLLYMANPSFVFFDSMFAYESLALPLAVFVVFAVVRRSYASTGQRIGLTLVAWLGLAAVVVTHHLTTYTLLAFLFLWTAVFLLLKVVFFQRSRHQKVQVGPGEVALVGLVLTSVWLIYTDGMAVAYLTPRIVSTTNQLVQILAHQKAPRQLFHSSTSSVSPLWERVAAYTSEALILLGLPFGLFEIWRRLRTNAIALAMACAVLVFPLSLVLHLTQSGAEVANRSTEFLFVAVAFVLAIGAVHFVLSGSPDWKRIVVLIGVAGMIYIGQMVLGNGQLWAFLPGPYMVGADARSIEPEGITAAEWAGAYLGPGHPIASDRDNTLLMATYGNEQAQTSGSARIPLSWVFFSPRFGPNVELILQQDGIQYLVVDLRLSTALPAVGTYFNSANAQTTTVPISPTALTKFNSVENVSRIFDSGDIVIYDVEAITKGLPVIPSTKGPPLRPMPEHVSPARQQNLLPP